MEYNTTRPKLIFSEYGRNMQRLIQYITQEKDKEKRTQMAKVLVRTMASMYPQEKNNEEFQHKLWDHLYIMSDFKLDVDGPFPPPDREATVTLTKPPKPLGYPNRKIKYKHYGKNIEELAKKAAGIEDKDKQDALVKLLASYMKIAHKSWHRETVSDDVILSDMEKLSGGKLKVDKQMPIKMHHPDPAPPKRSDGGGGRRKGAGGRRKRNNKRY